MTNLETAYFIMGFGGGGFLATALLRWKWRVLKEWQDTLENREKCLTKKITEGGWL
jgi:hypothetical protein